jgi:hypothetical protein
LVAIAGAKESCTVVEGSVVASAGCSATTEPAAFSDAVQGDVGVVVDGVGCGESTYAGADDNELHNLPLALFNIYDYNYVV